MEEKTLFTKTELKEKFRLKPTDETPVIKTFKNGYGKICNLYRKEDCKPMKAKSKKPLSEKQILNNKRLSLIGKMKSSEYMASSWAASMLEKDVYFLDTETTGLDEKAVIVQISIIDKTGKIIFDSLINPLIEIPEEAVNVHGITNETVKNSPIWKDVYQEIKEILQLKNVAIYNRDYDLRLIEQTSLKSGFDCQWINKIPFTWCVMAIASKFFNGSTDKRISLVNACGYLNIDMSNAHNSLADCEGTRKLLIEIAEYSKEINKKINAIKH